tara:strand:+ start:5693 stop:6757 length:1065 start_codon:yes stop_codon:yes gene_type:complete
MQFLYYKAYNFIENSQPTHLGIYFSLLLHLSILLFAVGLPDFFKPKTIPMPKVIPIEILNISDVTSLTPKKENTEIANKEIKKVKQKKFSSAQNTEIQKVELREKPKKNINVNTNESENILPQKPEQKKISLNTNEKIQFKDKDNLLTEKIETFKETKIKPKLKPKIQEEVKQESDLKIENKIKPNLKKIEKKIIDKPKPVEKPEPEFNLATMLKDLRNEDIANIIEDNEDVEEKEIIENDENQKNNLEVSISELDLVLQQLRGCFNPRAGTQIIGDEMVKIGAKIDRQANVRKDTVQIIATNISKNNPYYEAITESAVATLYNPLCSKLKLPLNKYDSWKDLKITIDYSWIKN